MITVLLRRSIAKRTACLAVRRLSNSSILNKRVSKLVLTDLAVLPDSQALKKQALVHAELSTGSVVLDTVRKYTKLYPHCTLLTQVGDFYEVYDRLPFSRPLFYYYYCLSPCLTKSNKSFMKSTLGDLRLNLI